MKKNILYLAIAVLVGLLIGYLAFGTIKNDSKKSLKISETHEHVDKKAANAWTCSMHPQIMQSAPGDCPICGMDLVPAASVAEGLAVNEIKMTNNAMALANIQTTIIGNAVPDNDDGIISLSGKIEANEENNSVQASYFDGRIERLNLNYKGQQVTRGQLLATIYAPSLVAAQQELITTVSLKKSQPALYKAVRSKLKNWKLSEGQIDAIESSGNVRDNFPIYATVSGTVSEAMAREGDYVKQGQPILKVSNLHSVWAQFDAYENQISGLKEGQKIEIVANAYPNKLFDGIISFINPLLDTSTRTVTLRATLKNTEDLFKPGMFVTGKLKRTKNSSDAMLIVPATAIMWTGERSLVYIKTNPNEPIFEMREVTLGIRNKENYAIKDGLNNGDEIVTHGTFTVDAAAQLQGKKSMMNRGEGNNKNLSDLQTKMNLTVSFQKDLKKIFEPYLQMKDAFVADDISQVSAFAKKTLEEIRLISIEDIGATERTRISKIIKMLEAIINTDSINDKRQSFVILNENLVAFATAMDKIDPVLYIQKCPMANNNKGAIWLSKDKNIRNPYYGEQMLTCGSTAKSLK